MKKNRECFFGPNLPKNGSLCQNVGNLTPDSESAFPRQHTCQFSGKRDNFDFFGLNLGKLPNYVRYFSFNNAEGVAENWVETEMSWVEPGGVGWRCMELSRGGWSWVEVGARFSNTLFKKRHKIIVCEICALYTIIPISK